MKGQEYERQLAAVLCRLDMESLTALLETLEAVKNGDTRDSERSLRRWFQKHRRE